MKVLMYEGIGRMEIEEVKKPSGGTLIKVLGCGICGTDLKTFLNGHHFFKPPTVLGHEFYGKVEKTETEGLNEGDLVCVAPYFECGKCIICKDGFPELCNNKNYVSSGAFAQYVSVPTNYEKGIFKIPTKEIEKKLWKVFTLVEPLACVLNGISHLHIKLSSRILIVGGGPMGVLFALYFQQKKIPVSIVEPNPLRSEVLKSWGMHCISPEEIENGSYDNIVISVNIEKLVNEYLLKVKDGGTILIFSGLKKGTTVSLDTHSLHYRQVLVTGSCGFASEHFKKAFEMISENPEHYVKLITKEMPLEKGIEAFNLLQSGKAFKIILNPWEK